MATSRQTCSNRARLIQASAFLIIFGAALAYFVFYSNQSNVLQRKVTLTWKGRDGTDHRFQLHNRTGEKLWYLSIPLVEVNNHGKWEAFYTEEIRTNVLLYGMHTSPISIESNQTIDIHVKSPESYEKLRVGTEFKFVPTIRLSGMAQWLSDMLDVLGHRKIPESVIIWCEVDNTVQPE